MYVDCGDETKASYYRICLVPSVCQGYVKMERCTFITVSTVK
jgi:hypothetical protein